MNKHSPPNTRQRFLLVCRVFLPIIGITSFLVPNWFDPHSMDFANYWQAGYMVRQGLNIYDAEQWADVRAQQGIVASIEKTSPYPLPFAVLTTPVSFLTLENAYQVWILVSQAGLLIAVLALLQHNPSHSALFEPLVIVAALMFRPIFTIVFSGQVTSFIFLFISLALVLFKKTTCFLGGYAPGNGEHQAIHWGVTAGAYRTVDYLSKKKLESNERDFGGKPCAICDWVTGECISSDCDDVWFAPRKNNAFLENKTRTSQYDTTQ